MPKKKIYTIVIIILAVAFFLANFCYPNYWNEKVDWLNSQKNKIQYVERLPNIFSFSEEPFRLGLDLQGGIHLIYEADLSNIEKGDESFSMQGLRDVIERRVNFFGIQEPVIQIQETGGHYRLIVELAGIQEPAQAIEMIGETPYLEFKEEKENFQEILEQNMIIAESGEGFFEEPFQATLLTGKYLKKAELDFDQTTYKPLVSLQFDEEGSKIFEELTLKNVNKMLAIYIDGLPISTPVVQEPISGGKAQISGNFTLEEARSLSRNLSAGALPVPIDLISQQSIGPTLGSISLRESLRAGAIGFLGIILFMILFYRLAGLFSALSLTIYIILLLSLFKFIPVTLTLAGIGGFILSIGMAIDANVLIFSRLREELKNEKSFAQALQDGFSRAWPAIRDGNITTLLVAIILFSFGTSFIKGFALTLSLGVLLSMFSAIVITKNFLSCFINTKLEKVKWLWH